MTRRMFDPTRGTPLGQWFRDNLRLSRSGLCITNLDYAFEDFRNRPSRKLMIIEEKQHMAELAIGQKLTFAVLDALLREGANVFPNVEYWGFYLLQMENTTPDDGGALLNGSNISTEQLIAHLNFDVKFCEPIDSRTDHNFQGVIQSLKDRK